MEVISAAPYLASTFALTPLTGHVRSLRSYVCHRRAAASSKMRTSGVVAPR
jgi:hypothetical protein